MSGSILAIDLGLRAGFACFGPDGSLHWYRSTNFGSPARMKKAAWGVLRDVEDLAAVVAEGDRNLGAIWRKVADKQNVEFRLIQAEEWRPDVLLERQQRSGLDAKAAADQLAREIIEQTGADKPTSLRHDAAEAILIGYWFWNLGKP